ncbi:unnamed protein product, partial [Discosporangium mesarthrocarpum]
DDNKSETSGADQGADLGELSSWTGISPQEFGQVATVLQQTQEANNNDAAPGSQALFSYRFCLREARVKFCGPPPVGITPASPPWPDISSP